MSMKVTMPYTTSNFLSRVHIDLMYPRPVSQEGGPDFFPLAIYLQRAFELKKLQRLQVLQQALLNCGFALSMLLYASTKAAADASGSWSYPLWFPGSMKRSHLRILACGTVVRTLKASALNSPTATAIDALFFHDLQ